MLAGHVTHVALFKLQAPEAFGCLCLAFSRAGLNSHYGQHSSVVAAASTLDFAAGADILCVISVFSETLCQQL